MLDCHWMQPIGSKRIKAARARGGVIDGGVALGVFVVAAKFSAAWKSPARGALNTPYNVPY